MRCRAICQQSYALAAVILTEYDRPAIFKTGNGESGNSGIGESDKNFIGFNLIYSIYNLCNLQFIAGHEVVKKTSLILGSNILLNLFLNQAILTTNHIYHLKEHMPKCSFKLFFCINYTNYAN